MESLERVRAIFNEAVELTGSARRDYLDRATAGEPELRTRVERLLAGAEKEDDFLASPTTAPGNGAARASAETPGMMIDRYKLLQLIGEGGFGSIWVAEQQSPVVRRVALKLIKLGMDTRQVISRFEAERQALAIMDHSGIARVFDAGATETGRPYFVMELVTGEPITAYCDAHNLTIRQRLELFTQVCQAVQYAHTKGIIHRDLKPSNVLVSTQDGRPLAKVIDFGIAKATAAPLTEKTYFTEYRQFVGTPEYMSPEQAEGSLDVDTRSDVYSLGVLLYELLIGAPPFDARSLRSAGYGEIQRIIRELDPPRPSTRLSQESDKLPTIAVRRQTEPAKLTKLIRGDLDWIVMKALEKDRQRRYDTASALALDVQRHLAAEPVIAAPPSRAYQARKFIARHRGPVVAASLVAAALVLGVIGTSIGLVWAGQQRRIAQGNERRAVEEASRAEREAERAHAAEQDAKQRAAELEQVADFQARMLRRIDAFEAGEGVSEDLRSRHEAALVRANVPVGEQAGHRAALEAELRRVNFTDLATAMIQRTILEPAVTAIDELFADQPVVSASLQTGLGEVHRALGLYDQALALHQQALKTCRETLGDEHAYTIRCLDGVGIALLHLGRPVEAEPYVREALEKAQRTLGDGHRYTLSAVNSMGSILLAQGRLVEAEAYLRENLQIEERLHGPRHELTLVARINLGSLLRDQGKSAEAESVLRQSVEGCTAVLGPDYPDTLVAMAHLADVLETTGKVAEAQTLRREVLEGSRRVHGEHHPWTLRAMARLAGVLINRRQFAEAEKLLNEVLKQSRDSPSEPEPEALEATHQFGRLLSARGRYAEAEACFRETLDGLQATVGLENQRAIAVLANLASTLREQSRLQEAEPLYQQAVEVGRRILGEDHPTTLTAVNGLGALLLDKGKLAASEPYLEEVYRKRPTVSGEDHPDTLGSITNLATLRWRQRRLPEAEALCLQALEKLQRLLGDRHPRTINALIGMGTILLDQQKLAEAEPYVREAVSQSRAGLGEDHRLSLMAAEKLANLLGRQGKTEESADLHLSILDVRRRTLGEDHTDTLLSNDGVGDALWRLGRAAAAAEHHRCALDGFLRKFGKDHAWTGDARLGLGRDLASLGVFLEGEAELLEAHRVFFSAEGGVSESWKRESVEALIDLYERWDTADAGGGHAAKAGEWRARLNALPSTRPTTRSS